MFQGITLTELHPLRTLNEVLVWQESVLLGILSIALAEEEFLHAFHHFLGIRFRFQLDFDRLSWEPSEYLVVLTLRLNDLLLFRFLLE